MITLSISKRDPSLMKGIKMIEYPKIFSPFKRDMSQGPNRNKLIENDWFDPAFAATKDLVWVWTEKVDGTNIRVHWDGHAVAFGGRTANASIPAPLVNALQNLFPEELFEQVFEDKEVTLFGEGYGAKIQKGGGNYRSDQSFVLFDIRIGNWWLQREDVEQLAKSMSVDVVPVVLRGTVAEAISYVRDGLNSAWGDFAAEGLVGVTEAGLLMRNGHRLQMKIKGRDFS